MFGKLASDLQTGIVIGNNSISGQLNYIADYSSAFSGDEASGNYLALKVITPEGTTVTGELINGVHGAVTLDDDGLIVFRIANNNQSVKFVATNNGQSVTKVYSLTNLVLNK